LTRPRVLTLLLAAALAGLFVEPGAAQTIVPGGPPTTVSTTTPGDNASVVFDAVAGQRVSLEITDVTIGASTCCSTRVSLLRPDGRTLAAVTVGTNGGFLDATALPSTGTYTVVVDPQSTNVGDATLTLQDVPPDVSGTVAAGGTPVTATTTVPGQNAVVAFPGTAGQRVSVQIADVTVGTSTCCSVRVSVLRPDGKILVAPLFVGSNGGFLDATTLPSTGTYTILVDPQGASTGAVSLALGDVPPDATASLAVGGSATVATAVPGQNAAVTFAGAAGQRVSVELTGVTVGTSLCCSTKVSILRPDGRVLVAPVLVGTNGGFLDATTLPSTGTYTVLVDPQGPDTGAAMLALYDIPADSAGALVAGAAPATLSTTVPGQNAVFTFTGTAGQRVSAVVDDVTVGTSSCCGVRLSLLRPNGSVLVGTVNAGTAGGFLDAVVLPQSGTYTIVVDPQSAATGSVRVTLHDVPPDPVEALAAGVPRNLTTAVPGQNAVGTFAGTSGQVVSVRIGPACCAARVSLVKPNGTTLVSTTTFATGGGFLDAVTLPQSGTYQVLVDYQGPATGDVMLTLHEVPADVVEPVAFGSSATVTTDVPGQNARVTFAGTVGGRASVRIAPICCLAHVSVLRPDGRTLVAPMLVGTSGGFVDAVDLPLTGTYTILVDYQGAATGNATISLHAVPADVTETITFGSARTAATTVPGQNAALTFAGTAGQRAAVRISGSCCTTRVSLLRPDGSTLASLTSFGSIEGFIEPVALPVTGTYSILVDPDSAATGGVTISLYDVPPDVTDTIAPGSPLRVTVGTPGQNARVSFAGTAGQEVSLRITDVTIGSILSGTTVSLRRPDGTTIVSTNVGTNGGFLDGRTLPVTGTYAVVVDPVAANTGGLTLTLDEVPSDVVETIAADGVPVTVTTSVAGQDARLDFSGTAGQRVSLKIGPSCCVGRVSITSPGGATLVPAATFGTSGVFVDTTTLAETGTYSMRVDYDGSSTGAVTLTLYDVPADLGAALVPGGAPLDVATTVPGQDAAVTFTGTIGARVSLRVGPSCCIGRVSIVRPNGSTLVSPMVFGAGGTFVDATELPESGTYTVVLDWDGPSTGAVTVTLHDVPPDATATATLGGPAVTVTTTVPGQNGRVSFAASAGDGVRLVTGPFNCCSIRSSIIAPDGTTVSGPTGFNPDGGTMDTRLAQGGTYTVLVDPQGPNSGGVSVRLEVDNTAPAPPLLSLTESGPDSHAVATTFFYRPAGTGGTFAVGAVASDGGTGLDRVTFPGLSGRFSPTSLFDDRIAPYGQTYSWTTGASFAGQSNLVVAYDRVGNSSAASFSVVPDSTAPTTSDNTGAIGSAWKNTTQIIVLSPSDGTGAGSQRTHFTTDGTTPTGASAQGTTVTVAAEGVYTVKYFSVDNVGNAEAARTAAEQIRIDKTAPSSATLDALPTVIRAGQALTGSGTDALSGVASIAFLFCPGASCAPTNLAGSSSTGPDYRVVWSSQPADGVYQVLARVRDAAGNTTDSAKRTVTIDNTAPQTTISSGPANPTNTTAATFSFTASEAGSSFECRVDAGAWTACTSPRSYGGLGEGSHAFDVRATDPVGNTDATPATRNWVVDLAAPETAIVSAPASPTSATSASFSFTSTEPGSTFECRFDGGAWTACASPRSYSGLADGSHGFEVRATDPAGNTDGSPASHAWGVDTAAPDTTITAAPATPTSSTSASFAFTASEGGATFQCRLDGGAWGLCSSPTSYSGLAEGGHVFEVRALDGIGNADTTPATHAWTVDLTAPQTAITAAPADPTNATSASFAFTANEGGATFECRLDGGAWSACASPRGYSGLGEGAHVFEVRATDAAGNTDATPATAGWVVDTSAPETAIVSAPADPTSATSASFSFTSTESGSTFECRLGGGAWAACTAPTAFAGLAEGPHTFDVRATDPAGNTDLAPATFTWTVDLTAPETTITAAPADPSRFTEASFSFSAGEPGATFECRLDAGPWAGCTSPATLSALWPGSHTFAVRATDAAGNVDPSPAAFSWVVDLAPPETAIASAPADPTKATSAAFSFMASESGSSFECRLDGGAWEPCASPVTFAGLADGPRVFEVRATDPAGNVDPTPAAHAWTIDTTAPTPPAIESPAEGTTNATATVTLSGTAEPGAIVEVFEGATSRGTTTTNAGGTWNRTLTSVADGSHTYTATARDAAGNTSSVSNARTVVVDTTAPNTVLTTGPLGATSSASASFTFTADDPSATFECRLDGGAWSPCSSPRSYTGLAEGPHTFDVRATDAAGNTDPTPATRAWTVDTTPPAAPAITSPADGATTASTALTVSGTAEPGAIVELFDGSTSKGVTTATSHGVWSKVVTALADGLHTFTVVATDAAGNTSRVSDARTIVVDTTAPETTIDSGPADPATGTEATFSFSADDASATFECRLDGGAWTACTSPEAVTGLASGAHVFEVRAVDAAGNADAVPAAHAWTVT
jgi:Bacterial Ig-like domain